MTTDIDGNEIEDESAPLTSDREYSQEGKSSKLKQIFKRLLKSRVFIGVTLGQLLSLLQSGSSVFSKVIQSSPPGPFHAPNSQYFMVNLTLALIFTTNLARNPRRFTKALIYRGILYFPVAVLDAEAAFLILLSFQYTTITSVNLMTSFVIVCTALLSTIFLSISYTVHHVMGIALAVTGIVVLLLVDVNGGNPYGILIGSSEKRLIGDSLVLLASLFYGISNVSAQVLSRRYGVAEFLGLHQLFAVFIIGAQLCVLERNALLEVKWNFSLVAFLSAYIVTTILFVVLLNILIKLSGATAVNVSLITTNFYNLIFGMLIFNYRFSWLYLVGFSTLISGLVLFYIRPSGKFGSFGVVSWVKKWKTWKANRSSQTWVNRI